MVTQDRTRLTDMLIRSEKMRPAGRKPSCGPLCAPRRAVLRVFQDHGQGRAAPGVARALGHAARGKAHARVHQRPQHDAVPRSGGGRLDADAAVGQDARVHEQVHRLQDRVVRPQRAVEVVQAVGMPLPIYFSSIVINWGTRILATL